GVHDRQPRAEIGDAPRLGAGTHHRGGVDSPGEETARDVRAEEAGRPGEEDSHGPYSADGSKRRTRILMPENHVTVQAAHVVSGGLFDGPRGRTARGDGGWWGVGFFWRSWFSPGASLWGGTSCADRSSATTTRSSASSSTSSVTRRCGTTSS